MAKRRKVAEDEPKTRTRRAWGGTVFERKDRPGSLWIKYCDPVTGKRRQALGAEGTDATAREAAERKLAEVTGKIAEDVERGVRAVDLRKFTDDELMPIVRSRTVKEHANEVERHLHLAAVWLGGRPMYAVTRTDAARYVAALRTTDGGVSPGTLRRITSSLSVAWRTAIDANAARENPWRGVQLPKRQEFKATFLTAPQLRKLYAKLPEPVHALCIVLGETGGRLGETKALQWHQVGDDFSSVTFTGTKTGKARSVPLTETAREVLKRLHAKRVTPMAGTDPVFPMAPVSRSHVRKLFRLAVKAAGLDARTRVHDLRHSFGSGLAAAGVPLNVIQKLMGHGTMAMTMRYAQWTPNGADALAVAALERARKAPAKRARRAKKAG